MPKCRISAIAEIQQTFSAEGGSRGQVEMRISGEDHARIQETVDARGVIRIAPRQGQAAVPEPRAGAHDVV
jgi:hypothetical protein